MNLKWRRAFHTKDGWNEDKSWTKVYMTMHDKTYILLHPIDEITIVNKTSNTSICYEYGNVRIKKKYGMSVAFVF